MSALLRLLEWDVGPVHHAAVFAVSNALAGAAIVWAWWAED